MKKYSDNPPPAKVASVRGEQRPPEVHVDASIFETISLGENEDALQSIPIPMQPITEVPDSSTPSEPFLRGTYGCTVDSGQYPTLPPASQSGSSAGWLRWLRTNLWIVPLTYCAVTPLIWLSTILAAVLHGQSILMFNTVEDGHLSPQASYFASFSQLSALLMATTCYLRYCQVDYYLACAAQKIKDRMDSLTATDFMRNDPAFPQKDLLETVSSYQKTNSSIHKLCYFAAFFFAFAGNFRFYPTPAIYGTSYILYASIIFIYCVSMIDIISFLSRHFKYETLPVSLLMNSFIGAIFLMAYIYITIFISARIVPLRILSIPATIFEWLSNAHFPIFAFCTYRRMRAFDNWESVNLSIF